MSDGTKLAEARNDGLASHMEALAQQLAEREAEHGPGLARARQVAEILHRRVEDALGRFNAAVEGAGAHHLVLKVGPVRPDQKHVRAVEFELERGRHRAIVTVKSRGDVTLVGPFRQGKPEGPCRTFPFEPQVDAEFDGALESFLGRFAEEAATP